MKNKIIRLINAKKSTVHVELQRVDSDNESTVLGTFNYDNITGDISIKWCFQCPLSLIDRLGYVLWFVKFLRTL